jgi:hypothetical protein
VGDGIAPSSFRSPLLGRALPEGGMEGRNQNIVSNEADPNFAHHGKIAKVDGQKH